MCTYTHIHTRYIYTHSDDLTGMADRQTSRPSYSSSFLQINEYLHIYRNTSFIFVRSNAFPPENPSYHPPSLYIKVCFVWCRQICHSPPLYIFVYEREVEDCRVVLSLQPRRRRVKNNPPKEDSLIVS